MENTTAFVGDLSLDDLRIETLEARVEFMAAGYCGCEGAGYCGFWADNAIGERFFIPYYVCGSSSAM
ncbi:hypothetical protein Rhe02_19530 [Rhizocola hellebori]|uniref:Uncharacterized protein n=1 Tax=Rhizocola hellebori TaxID=1392758 RepID=A0A8J3Q537_9ACTN|nr:hypothetical protein [Rhizocola hellebori]GIH03886.1 hypothetical protein Rhe02_19530 [Rhizocola hellebori]